MGRNSATFSVVAVSLAAVLIAAVGGAAGQDQVPTMSVVGASPTTPEALPKELVAFVGLGGPADRVVGAAQGGRTIVYFQSQRAEEVEAVRAAAEAAGVLGTAVFADQGGGGRIGLASNLADKVFVSAALAGNHAVMDEAARVLRPGGLRIIDGTGARTDATEAFRKPAPAGKVDDWSHPYHGPDNNPLSTDALAVAPYQTQFLSEPKFSPMPEVTVAAGGRLFRAMGNHAMRVNQNAPLNTLFCINAYNGTVLWTRPLREGFLIHRCTMIATPEVLYLGDDISCKRIDAASGQVIGEITVPADISDGPVWKWMALDKTTAGKFLLCALVGGQEVSAPTIVSKSVALGHWPWGRWPGYVYDDPRTNTGFGRTLVGIDPVTGAILWHHRQDEYIDGRGVCMSNGRIYFYSPDKSLSCLDAANGQIVWQADGKDLLEAIGSTGPAQHAYLGFSPTSFIKCDRKYVYLAGPQRPNLVVVSAADGKLAYRRAGGNVHLILGADFLYAIGGNPGGKIEYGTWNPLVRYPSRRNCARTTGSADAIFYRAREGTVRIDLATDVAQHIAPMRPPCQDGVIVSNGMLHWGPWMCGCPLALYGQVTLAPAEKLDPAWVAEDARLERGPVRPSGPAPVKVRPGDWPCWGGDAAQSCLTTVRIAPETTPAWSVEIPSSVLPTGAVTASGTAFVADRNGTVRALSVRDGKELWKASTGGPIYYAPAIAPEAGAVVVGSADGHVYAFDAASGKLLWRFRVGPAERRIPVFGRLISTWPVAGGVVVQNGVIFAAGGIADYDGTFVCALDAATGKPRWINDAGGTLNQTVRTGVSLQGPLSIRKGQLQFPGGSVFLTARYNLSTGACMVAPQDSIRSAGATAFGAYYPEYDRYANLACTFEDGTTLSHSVRYDLARQSNLALLKPASATTTRPAGALMRRRRGSPPRQAVWESGRKMRCSAFIVGTETFVAAGETATGPIVAAMRVSDGVVLWEQRLAAPVVQHGLAIDADGNILASLLNGAIVCLRPVR